MENFPYQQEAMELSAKILDWLMANVFVLGTAIQLGVVVLIFFVGRLASSRFEVWLKEAGTSGIFQRHSWARAMLDGLGTVALPALWFLMMWASTLAAAALDLSHHVLQSLVGLLTAWIIIRLASTVIKNEAWSRALASLAWLLAALNMLGLLGPTTQFLDGLALELGATRISALSVIKGIASVAVLMWIAGFISTLFEDRLRQMRELTPSVQVLLSKVARIILFTLAILLGMNSVGIDLTALAVFSGAIGLGLGFGLQKVVSNLISGVILLLDKSVKPGDVIAIGTTYGWINKLSARYVSVITRDGIEHLIPNEELITQRVENWSFSDTNVRLKLPIGVSYGSDVRKAMELCIQAGKENARVLDNPPPVCQLKNFGDNAVLLELRVWVADPQNGMGNIRSAIHLAVWDLFHENGVEFPFPQRDLHIKSSVPFEIKGDSD